MAKSNSTATHAIEINAASLPSYIVERHQRAAAAGVTIEKQRMHDGKLRISYLGTAEQLIAADFITDAAVFLKAVAAPTKSIHRGHSLGKLFSPTEYGCHGHLYRTTGLEIRLANGGGERLPIKEWEPCTGVKAYEFFIEHLRYGVCHVFVAKSAEVLVKAGLAPQSVVNGMKTNGLARAESSRHEMTGMNFELWAMEKDTNFGVVKFYVYPENLKWAERNRLEQPKPEHASPEEYRQARLDIIELLERTLTEKSTTKDGRCLSIGDDDVGEIQRLFSELEGILTHCAILNEKDPEAAERKAAEAKFAAVLARRDPEFHSFLDQSLKMRKSAAGASATAKTDTGFHEFMERTTKG